MERREKAWRGVACEEGKEGRMALTCNPCVMAMQYNLWLHRFVFDAMERGLARVCDGCRLCEQRNDAVAIGGIGYVVGIPTSTIDSTCDE